MSSVKMSENIKKEHDYNSLIPGQKYRIELNPKNLYGGNDISRLKSMLDARYLHELEPRETKEIGIFKKSIFAFKLTKHAWFMQQYYYDDFDYYSIYRNNIKIKANEVNVGDIISIMTRNGHYEFTDRVVEKIIHVYIFSKTKSLGLVDHVTKFYEDKHSDEVFEEEYDDDDRDGTYKYIKKYDQHGHLYHHLINKLDSIVYTHKDEHGRYYQYKKSTYFNLTSENVKIYDTMQTVLEKRTITKLPLINDVKTVVNSFIN